MKWYRKRVAAGALVAVTAIALSVSGASGRPSGAEPVRVVVLVVDGLDPEDVNALDSPNIQALREGGTWWEQARSIFVAETIPNHTAMMTGAYAKRSGIPVNTFWSRRADDEPVDMQDPVLLKAETMFTAIQKQCPDLRTAAILSKTYLHGIFSGDGDGDGNVDADFLWEPGPIIPESDHAPDTATTEAVLGEIPNSPDLMFVNLGDVDRSGHVDPSGVQDPAIRRLALQNTDVQVGRIVDALEAEGLWESTVMLLVSDHSMDWSAPGDFISLDEVFAADPRTADRYVVVQNGGVDNVYLQPGTKNKNKVLKAMHSLASETDGVEHVFYRTKNKRDPKGQRLLKVWKMHSRRVGDLVAFAAPGRRFSDPDSTSNPIPGNHGHPITRHSVALVAGGSPLVLQQSIAPSDPDAVDPFNDTKALSEQSEQVDIGVTVARLLGVEDPGVQAGLSPQYQGRVLDEALSARPAPACA